MRLLAIAITAVAFLLISEDKALGYNPSDLAPTTVCHVGGKTQMLCLHNWTRKAHGLVPLTGHPKLYVSAGQKGDLIEACNEFSHTPCGHNAFEFLLPTGLCAACAENIAYGFQTVRFTYTAWLDSPGHYNDIINPAFRYYGSSFRSGPLPYLWTVNFGS